MPCMSCGGARDESPREGCKNRMNHLSEATRKVIEGRLRANQATQKVIESRLRANEATRKVIEGRLRADDCRKCGRNAGQCPHDNESECTCCWCYREDRGA